MTDLSFQKHAARQKSLALRKVLRVSDAGASLAEHFPAALNQQCIAGFAPIGDEIDIWPLLKSLNAAGRRVALPVVVAPEAPLDFRQWQPGCELETDRYGISFPKYGEKLSPTLLLIPLLAFTPTGDRLGYGGGYYDRTLAALRSQADVFACGVAYAGQEVENLPTGEFDARLDAILTEQEYRTFT